MKNRDTDKVRRLFALVCCLFAPGPEKLDSPVELFSNTQAEFGLKKLITNLKSEFFHIPIYTSHNRIIFNNYQNPFKQLKSYSFALVCCFFP